MIRARQRTGCDESGMPKEGASIRYVINLNRQMRGRAEDVCSSVIAKCGAC